MRNRNITAALVVLIALHAIAVLAGFFAPYDPTVEHRDSPYAPPMRIHFVDNAGRWHVRPFVYAWTSQVTGFAEYREDISRQHPLRFLVEARDDAPSGTVHSHLHLFGVERGQCFLLGTDGYGRDVLSRVIWGGRISLFAGLMAAFFSLTMGMLIGSLAGYYGGMADETLMRGSELFLAVPWLYLLLAVRAFLPLQISPVQAFLAVVFVVGAVGWARPARLIRGVVLSARERNYVLAARGFGASGFYLMRKHIFPQVWGVIVTQAALLIPQYILAETTLSFFGLGVGEPAASWGNMLASLQQYFVLTNYWWMLSPALMLIPVTWAYSVFARSLVEQSQPVLSGLRGAMHPNSGQG
jgi:peptide/nickel transport system permease protein